MSVTIPPVPYKSPIVSETGFLTPPWEKWFRELFMRIGGVVALSNTELETQLGGITDVETQVVAHDSSLDDLENEIDYLKRGPVL